MASPRRLRLLQEDLHRVVQAIEGPAPDRALRARALLLAHWGHPADAVARELNVDPETLAQWEDAYAREGLGRLLGQRGRTRMAPGARAERVRHAIDEVGASSVRRVAAAAGLPVSTTFRLMRQLLPLPDADVGSDGGAGRATLPPRFAIVGCGGAGGRTLHKVAAMAATTIAIDTDKVALDAVDADTRLLIGKSATRGLGASGAVDVAARAAELAEPAIEKMLAGAELVILTAGMGGGTGTGSAPIVARIARRRGATVLAIVSMPFHVERARLARAETGVAALRAECDTLLLLANDRLLTYAPNLPMEQAFRVMDALIAETLHGIVRFDLAETRRILLAGGGALLLYGESRTGDPQKLVHDAFAHPFLDGDPRRATGALVQVTGGSALSLGATELINDRFAAAIAPGASLACGARVAPEMGARLRVTAILTGLPESTP